MLSVSEKYPKLPNQLNAASNSSSNSISRMSAHSYRRLSSRSRATRRAFRMYDCVRSTPVITRPMSESGNVSRPWPHGTSSALCPLRIRARYFTRRASFFDCSSLNSSASTLPYRPSKKVSCHDSILLIICCRRRKIPASLVRHELSHGILRCHGLLAGGCFGFHAISLL